MWNMVNCVKAVLGIGSGLAYMCDKWAKNLAAGTRDVCKSAPMHLYLV
jgi:hypothetical protein